ncbi:MAG: hypothetical protein ACKVS8_10340 [Phycisphaerales bacterium]
MDEADARGDEASEPVRRVVEADWDDVVGAVDLAASESEVAVVVMTVEPAGLRWFEAGLEQKIRWEFVSVYGDAGWLEASRDGAKAADEITLECRFDEPPKSAAERALIARVVERLERMRGQRAAAIGEPFGVPAK